MSCFCSSVRDPVSGTFWILWSLSCFFLSLSSRRAINASSDRITENHRPVLCIFTGEPNPHTCMPLPLPVYPV
ncbi:hypothetical protein GDO81_026187 [Engystomops pustulosus]|uniref:Secreted protein n=1 Tax=Engystomops pustulosus TaxID=76066 RepID=A0AAV6YKA8_ENGPU|nr:hypothetical protein GDO81_026187 [Engystomops pustulosus]